MKVFGDDNRVDWLTSITLYPQRPSAQRLAELYPHVPTGHRLVAFWTPGS